MKSWAWVLTIFLSIAMLCVLAWKLPSNSSEWASWSQAIGTVAALFGVLWVAHADARRQRDEKLARAAVTVAVLKSTLPYVTRTMNSAARILREPSSDVELRPLLLELRKAFDDMPIPTEEQMLRLVPVGAQFSAKFAQAIAYTMQVQVMIASVLDDLEKPKQLGKGVDALQQMIALADRQVQACIDDLGRLSLIADVSSKQG